jgi:hypothetical protein
MTQEVDAQPNEWITNAAPAEDTYATAPSETEYVVPDSTDPSTLITALQERIDQLEKNFTDSKHVTNRATSSLDRLNNKIEQFATKQDLEATVENVNGIRTLMEVGLSDVMSEEGREIVAQQQQSTAYNSMLSQAKDEMRQELNGASPDSVAGQVTNEQLDETEMRARAASDRVYGYAEARGISAEDVHNLPIWNAPNKTLEEAIQSAKEYIDTMANGSNPNQIAQSKQAAGATPARASSSSQVLTIEKMKNMSPQEIMKIPKEIRNQALRGG